MQLFDNNTNFNDLRLALALFDETGLFSKVGDWDVGLIPTPGWRIYYKSVAIIEYADHTLYNISDLSNSEFLAIFRLIIRIYPDVL